MPIRDLLFARHNLRDNEFTVFSQLHAALFPKEREPDAIVYLTADADVLMKRIAKRGRSFEHKITRKYIESVSNMFHKHFLACEGKTVLVVNTNDYNIVEDSGSVVDIFEQLLHTRSELQYYTPPVK
ncbi:MAG: deoxynucleoside kinase [Planctomycetota bacterium]|nr:deoxynucleoside kinase [Planctomycetota bacterium]